MSEPVRVLINALHAKTGGGVTYLQAMLPRLAANDELEVHLLLHQSQLGRFDIEGLKIRRLVANFKNGFVRRLVWEQIMLPILAWSIADVTFSPANFGPLLAPSPVVLLRNALDVEQHEARLTKRFYWKILGVMTWLSLLRAPLAAAVSDYARKKLAFGFRKKVRVIPHGVDASLFRPPEKERGDFILAVGDITVQKNFKTLIRAVATLTDARLLIVGQRVEQEHARQLETLVAALKMEERVRFLGRIEPPELAALYRGCRIFAFSSTVETFGNPLVEAMACGCPILCSQSSAMPEILGDAGIYAEALNDADWAAGLARLWTDAKLRDDLSARAIERARRFRWDDAAEETAKLLIAAAHKPAPSWRAIAAWAWVASVFILYLAQFKSLLPALIKALSWH